MRAALKVGYIAREIEEENCQSKLGRKKIVFFFFYWYVSSVIVITSRLDHSVAYITS